MSNIERIRNFSSYEMAVMLTKLIKETENRVIENFKEAGVTCTKVELDDEIQIEIHKKWLESEDDEEK